MKFNLDLFLYDCYNLHETQEIPMELLYSSAAHILPSFTGISTTYWNFYRTQYLLATTTPVQKLLLLSRP